MKFAWKCETGTGADRGLVGWGNNEAQYYRGENVAFDGEKIIITAKREDFGGKNYTSGRVYTHEFSVKYGRIEAKIKLPAGNGLWPAFWMMPKESAYGGWAASGEIDIMENRGRLPNIVSGAIHFGGQHPNNRFISEKYTFPDGFDATEFNIYAVEWDENGIRWFVNDCMYFSCVPDQWTTVSKDGTVLEKPAPFDREFYIILNLAVGGHFDNGIEPDASESSWTMEVEYVSVVQDNS
jgi:Beta-glucanase/Beta-glucan synthetase